MSKNGKAYTVERTIHFTRKRGTAEEYGDPKQDAVLTEPDGLTVRGQEKVNARCSELLGMDVEQFRKIIMLAQGEFREFLKANSEKKNEILGRLFDNSAFTRYQNLIGGARAMLQERRRENQEKLTALIREGFPEEEQVNYHPESPDFLDRLARLVREDEERLAELGKRKEAALELLAKLNKRHGEAALVNRDLEELDKQRERMALLTSREGEIKALKQRTETAAAALRAVKPGMDARTKAEDALRKGAEELRRLEAMMQACERELENALAAAAGDAEAKARTEALGQDIHALREQLPRYREMEEKVRARDAAALAERKAGADREASEQRARALKEEQDGIAEVLEALKDIDHLTEERAKQEEEARKAVEALTGKGGVAERARALKAEEAGLRADEIRLAELSRKALEAENRHHDLYRRFIAGQAGLLAETLRQRIDAEGEAACPVCGALHRRGDETHLARMAENTPDEKKVEAAKKAAEQAEASRKGQDAAVQEKRAGLERNRHELLMKAFPLFPDCAWESLSSEAFLEAEERRLRERSREAAAALRDARNKRAERDGALRAQAENRENLERVARQIEELKAEESRQHAAFAAAQSAAEAMRRTLKLASAEETEQQIAAWEREQEALQRDIRAHEKAETDARAALNRTKGSLEGKRNEIPSLREALALAEEALKKALAEHGFPEEKDALAALEPIGRADGEQWLQQQNQTIHDFVLDWRNTKALIASLEEKTEGKRKTDLKELGDQINARKAEQALADSEYNAGNAALSAHRRILDRARETKQALSLTDGAWQRLNALGTLALGSAGDGGKISFDRYVMGAVFRDILEMANRRINIMSGGRYELVHKKDTDRKNAKAGLEIEVLDTATGRVRPSSLLSGGEGFYASLSLALGLSDAVQNHAGGKKLDALFIDEGFGTLSPDVLDKAMEVLNQLSAGNRLVGIISHVDKLDESIPQKIRVTCDERGSHAKQELS